MEWVLLFWLCICDNGIVQQVSFFDTLNGMAAEEKCEEAKEQFVAEASKGLSSVSPTPKAVCVRVR